MLLTIFTPTFNRKKLLGRLYKSLLSQTDTDFEWILVDDGSTDGTCEWIASLPQTPYKFKYIQTSNCGKHIAINRGIAEASGKWFFIVDSDDYLIPEAVAKLKELMKQTPANREFAGFCTNRLYENGTICGCEVNYSVLDTDFISYSLKYGSKGEKPSCLRTDIWKEFLFPEYEGEKFCSEALVLRRMACKYKVRYFNESVYIMEGYLEDGLTHSLKKHFYNSPTYAALLFKEQLLLPSNSWKYRIATIYNYWYYYLLVPNKRLEIMPGRILRTIGYPIYIAVSLMKKFLRR